MKNLKNILLFLMIVSPFNVFSQEDFSKAVIEPLQKDYLYREKVFIHINKTIYFSEEKIWFTTYVANDDNTPSEYSTNLHVNLLNDNGEVIDSKNVFINQGVGFGDFFISATYPSGKYYIQGFTNYMQNFGTKNTYIQEIELINPLKKDIIEQKEFSNIYDIQIFPESGHLLENTENIIGIKALINGKAQPFSGKIINSKGIEVSNFNANFIGMSKCNFMYIKDETYSAIVDINNTLKTIPLPKAIKTGIIFSVDNSAEDKTKLLLKTNKETLPTLINTNLKFLFYRNNSINDAISLDFTGNEITEQELLIDKNKMLHGINIVTLFKNNNPIAERKFFINKPSHQNAIFIEELETVNDSIKFKIQTLDSNFNPTSAKISISTLPKESTTFSEKQNIKSAFLLSPYLKGHIENPSLYFKNTNPKEKEYLDLLLLNQGWTTYSLEEKINEINPKELFPFERGFSINGKIKKYPKGYDIGLLSKQNRFVSFSKFNENDEFLFKNIFAYKNDTIKLSLIKKGRPLFKPNKLTQIKPKSKKLNYNFLVYKYKQNLISVENKNSSSIIKNNSQFNELPKLERLQEVILKTIYTKREKTHFELKREMAQNRNILGGSFYKGAKVSKQMEVSYENVISYLISLGYVKGQNPQYITLRTGTVTLNDPVQNSDGSISPSIYIDDHELEAGDTSFNKRARVNFLKQLPMRAVDEIYINKTGGGSFKTGGTIRIYLKKGDHSYSSDKTQKLYEELILLTGFDRASNYYRPLYNIYSKDAFNLTEIDWKNNLETNENGEVFIKIPKNDFSNEFQFIINGFSESGLLFNTIYKTGSANF